jgi:hypothetical protein
MLVGSRRNATVRAILDAHGIAYLVRHGLVRADAGDSSILKG